mgnify:CR=1 FL=1|tara:strand:+ start:10857 stop:20246 length:9390 start_codon:yes stop_codon:yes gene_type:complete
MGEIYYVGDKRYSVKPDRLEKFKLEFAGNYLTEEEYSSGKTNDLAISEDATAGSETSMASNLETTSSESASGFESIFEEKSQTTQNKYEHVSVDEFVAASTDESVEGGGVGYFMQKKHDRENTIKSLYEEKFAGTDVRFETGVLDGNIMTVFLPGEKKGRPFKLSSDPSEAAGTHVDITEYIENRNNVSIDDETVKALENQFELGTLYTGSNVFSKKYNQQSNNTTEIVDKVNDLENLQKTLGSDYKVEDSGMFNGAYVIEAPGGGKRTFTKHKTTASDIVGFMKRNPRSIEQTKEFIKEEKEFKAKAQKDITEEVNKMVNAATNKGGSAYNQDEILLQLKNPKFRAKLEEKILSDVNVTSFSKMRGNDGTITSKNLTNEHLDEISSGVVGQALDIFTENLTNEYASSEESYEKSKGKTIKTIKQEHFDANIAGLDEFNQQIANLWKDINDPELEDKRTDNLRLLKTAVALYDEKHPNKPYVFNYDVATGQRALVVDEKNKGIVNLSKKIQEQVARYETLDHSTLDQELFTVNLAHTAALKEFNTKKNNYKVIDFNEEVKFLSPKDREKYFNDRTPTTLGPRGSTYRKNPEKSDMFFTATAKEAGALGLQDPLLQAQQTFITDLEVRKQALIQLQLLNKRSTTIGRSGFGEVFGETLLNSFGLGSDNISDSKLVAAMNEELENEGVTLTTAESNLYNVTDSEALGEALGGLPRLVVDFAIANKVAAGVQSAVGIDRLYKALNAKRYYSVGKNGRKVFTKIPKQKDLPGGFVSRSSYKVQLARWAKGKGLKTAAPVFWKQAASTTLTGLIEGVKMEAVMGPGSFATGVGFGMAGKIIPWGVVRGSNWGKTMFDYGIKSPINFTIGAEAGEIMNGLANDMMNKKDFGDFMHEHYSDYDAIKQRTIANLVSGFAMRFSHISKFDFKSNKQIRELQIEAQGKINKAKNLYMETLKSDMKGVENPLSNRRRTKFEDIVEKEQLIVDLATRRLHEINNTEAYLDPVLGPQKVANDLKRNSEKIKKELGKDSKIEVKDVEVVFTDANIKGSYIYNPKTKNIVFNVNPKNITPGLTPHEVGHGGLEMLAGKDAMIKAEFVTAIDNVSKKIVMEDGRTLFETMESLQTTTIDGRQMFGSNVLRRYDVNRVVISEKLQYLAEAMADPQVAAQIRKSYGFDMYSNALKKFMKEKLDADTNFNTEKEVALWADNYISSIKKGVGIGKSFKHLENWISIEATDAQMKARQKYESENFIIRETSMKSEVFDKTAAEKEVSSITEKIKKAAADFNSKKISKSEFEKLDTKSMAVERARIQELIKTGRVEQTRFEREVSQIYESKTLSKTDKAFYISELWDPRGYIDPLTGKRARWSRNETESNTFEKTGGQQGFKKKPDGAIALERVLNKYEKVDGYELKRDDIIDDIVSGAGRQSQRGDKFNKARSVRQMVMDFKPVDNPGVTIASYVNSLLLGSRKRYLEHVQYHLKDSKLGFKTTMDKTKDVTGDANLNTYTMSEKDISQYGDTKVIFELPINKEAFNKDKGWKSTIEKNYDPLKNTSLSTTPDLAPNFTREMMGVKLSDAAAKRTNDLGEKNLTAIQNFMEAKVKVPQEKINEATGKADVREISMLDTFRRLLNEGAVSFDKGVRDDLVGKSTGNRNLLLDAFYHEATQQELLDLGFKISKATGRVSTAAGQQPMVLNKNITDAQILEFVGIKDGKRTKISQDRSLGGKGRIVLEVFGGGVTRQTLRLGDKLTVNQMFDMGAGRNRALMSEVLGGKDYIDQKAFLDIVKTKRFSTRLEENKSKYDTQKEALQKTLIEEFTLTDIVHNFTPKQLLKISDQLAKEYEFTSITAATIRVKSASQMAFKIDLKNIEKEFGIDVNEKITELFDKKGVEQAQVTDKLFAEFLIEKYGKGAYETFMLSATSSGAGVGVFKTRADMDINNPNQTLRYSIYESADAAYKMLDGVYKKLAKKGWKSFDYVVRDKEGNITEGQTRADSDLTSNKSGLFKKLMDKGKENWNEKQLDKFYKVGEANKDILKESIEFIKDLYDGGKGVLSSKQVRQFVEIHAGSMPGLIKKAASFSTVPNMSPKEMFKLFPETVTKTRSKDVYYTNGKNKGKLKHKKGSTYEESNYVLEHTTPAKYIKARIYDYILSNGDPAKKQAMDLTLRDYHTTFIPKGLDTMVNKILQENLPANHVPGMDPIGSRYYMADHSANFGFGLRNFAGNRKGKIYDKNFNMSFSEKQKLAVSVRSSMEKFLPEILRKNSSEKQNSEILDDMKAYDKAMGNGRKRKKKSRGMSTFDFDETVGVSENYVFARKAGKKKKISSAQWPFVGEKLVKEGWKMDFTDFNRVTNGKPGPLMQKMKNQIKKFGPENVFILTARAKESQKAIHDWLKSEGVEIPLENITGLGNSTGEAKAMWMLKKFAEGYNDMYFVDDAMPNVKAVRDVLTQLDIKSKVQQALMSENLSKEVNDIMEHSLDIDSGKRFSKAEAKFRGSSKKRRRFFIPDSAADHELLIEPLYGKGKKGQKNKDWFEKNYYKVWERNINNLNNAKQSVVNDYMALRKTNKDIIKSLDKAVEGTNFTKDAAVRVYLWNKSNYKIPGLAKGKQKQLVEFVENDNGLRNFAEKLLEITKEKQGFREPGENWWGETIASEISSLGRGVSRKAFLKDWLDVKNEIFSTENLNKMEAELGPRWRESMEGMLYRMETGSTRNEMGRTGNTIMNYLNGSVGTIMNFNTRSATLQLISTVNFINHAENNPLAASKAFLNQPQYWRDFKKIMNSDMLKQRRQGLEMNVTEAELAAAANVKGKGALGAAKRAFAQILKAGYLPTKMADSFAISAGGATYYRNRINKYLKEGFTAKEADSKAWIDFQAVAEKTQQSSRPDLLSQQQVSFEGRLLLPFANTPMQMNRIMMKEILDISKGRFKGVLGENSLSNKMGKIAYYGGIQSAIFAGLQSGLFALMAFGDDDEKTETTIERQQIQTINTMLDSFLRGMGITGVVASGFIKAIQTFKREDDKGAFKADYDEVAEALLNMSPTIGSKFSKLDQAGNAFKYNRKEIMKKGLSFDNPHLISATALTTEALFNIPVNRALVKVENIKSSIDSQNEVWRRVFNFGGWNQWSLGVEPPKKTKRKKSRLIM